MAVNEQPLTIYFDLSLDARPTMGALGKAMLEIEKLAGETIFLLEPGTDFSLVFQYSSPGSLRIIAGLRGLLTRERLKILAVIVATTLVNNGVNHLQGKAMDAAIRAVAGEGTTLTEEDLQRIAEAIRNVERSETVVGPRREFYRAIARDNAITGIGATPDDRVARPLLVVPRSEIEDRAADSTIYDFATTIETRPLVERLEVVLVQAPLIESNRQWRIFARGTEFGAKMLDENFKKKILDGTTDLRLAGGVILDVTLETTQENVGDLWRNRSFAVTHVHGWRQNPEQADFLLSHEGDDAGQEN